MVEKIKLSIKICDSLVFCFEKLICVEVLLIELLDFSFVFFDQFFHSLIVVSKRDDLVIFVRQSLV
jgi:hypothetical protein